MCFKSAHSGVLEDAFVALMRAEDARGMCAFIENVHETQWCRFLSCVTHLFFVKSPCGKVFLRTARRALMQCRLQGGGRFDFCIYYYLRVWLLCIRWPNKSVLYGCCGSTYIDAFCKLWKVEEKWWSPGRAAWMAAIGVGMQGQKKSHQ